jgi:hypothetical protein
MTQVNCNRATDVVNTGDAFGTRVGGIDPFIVRVFRIYMYDVDGLTLKLYLLGEMKKMIES